jgi:hypothetical protein
LASAKAFLRFEGSGPLCRRSRPMLLPAGEQVQQAVRKKNSTSYAENDLQHDLCGGANHSRELSPFARVQVPRLIGELNQLFIHEGISSAFD